MYKYTFCIIYFSIFSMMNVVAQDDDNVAWLSVSANTQIQEGLTFALTPILRLNEDFSEYQNFSIDYAFTKKLKSNWKFTVLGRTWFLPDGTNRQFLWPALSFSQKVGDFAWSHRVRWHLAFDIDDRFDPDFIRYFQTWKYTGWGNFQPFVGLELWWGLNGDLQIERLRYIPGASYKINNFITLSAALWRQESLNLLPEMDVNLWRVNLVFKLPPVWKDKG